MNKIEKIKPVLVLCSTAILFPLGYFFCALYYRMNVVVSVVMSLSLIIIGFILVGNLEDIISVGLFLNMLSFGFLLVYLAPLFEKGVFRKTTNQNKKLQQKIILIISRLFVLIILLMPASLIPLHMSNEGKDIEIILKSGGTLSFPYFEAEIIVFFTVVWYVLAIYSYFKPSSYFLEE